MEIETIIQLLTSYIWLSYLNALNFSYHICKINRVAVRIQLKCVCTEPRHSKE